MLLNPGLIAKVAMHAQGSQRENNLIEKFVVPFMLSFGLLEFVIWNLSFGIWDFIFSIAFSFTEDEIYSFHILPQGESPGCISMKISLKQNICKKTMRR